MGVTETVAWKRIVGADGVVTDKESLRAFASDDSNTLGERPRTILRPRKAEEVQEIVQLANQKGIALVPRSSTGPRSRGDTVPQAKDSVIVDLSGMTEILRLDVRNKVAMIQPGVTFGALQDACAKVGLRVPVPLLPMASTSVMGAYLEREPHTIPKYHWDMSDPICCLEVIFGSGHLFRTGSAAGPGTLEQQWAAGQAQKTPMGPSQTDFMKIVQGSQGTMGIATWATIKLELMPQAQKGFFVGAAKLEDVEDFTYALMRARMPDECLILNRVALAAIMTKDAAGRDRLAENLPEWVLFYAVAGYERLPQERVDYLTRDIADIAAACNVKPVEQLATIQARTFLGLLSRPGPEPYWKTRHEGACREIFFLNTLDRAQDFVKACRAECDRQGFAESGLGIYIQPIQQGRNVHIEFDLMYPPEDPASVERVKTLYQDISTGASELGGFFSRPYGLWSDLAYPKCPDTVKALGKVKRILDPAGIMNPGKLCFGKGV